MGENICKCSNLQGINLQNIQTFKQSSKYTKYAAQYQTEQNYPIKKMNRFKQTFLQEYIKMTKLQDKMHTASLIIRETKFHTC